MFQFLRSFLIPFFFFCWKWILNIEMDYIRFANLLSELSSLILSLLNLYPSFLSKLN